MIGFPPIPVFPLAVDSDTTLFKVYNTTETTITANNQAWSEEIPIKAVGADEPEIWADNGYATIEGELLYYDAVEKDGNDKIFKLKRCCRNIGGRNTQYNAAGTWIRGFVIAEHHNQITTAIINVENFVGENFSEDETTLDWRIRHLQAESLIFDNSDCPDVELDFQIVSSNPNTGSLAQYSVNLNGVIGSVQIQFGDGSSTTQTSGTHQYAPNANIDPVLIVTNGNCQIIQTPIARDQTDEPQATPIVPPFTVPVPQTPTIPNLIFPSIQIPSTDINIPPIVMPCDFSVSVDLPSIISVIISGIQLPSVISFTPVLNIPSVITFTPEISIPSTITFDNVPTFSPINFGPSPLPNTITFGPSDVPNIIDFGPSDIPNTIDFGPAPSFPSSIDFGPGPTFPSTINFGPAPTFGPISFNPAPTLGPISFDTPPLLGPISFVNPPLFTPISFGTAPTFAPISFGPAPTFDPIAFDDPPVITVDWGTPPVVSCTRSVACPSASPAMTARANPFGEIDPAFDAVELQYDMVGFPSEIKVIPPVIPPIDIKHDIPEFIKLVLPDFNQMRIPVDMPSEIKLVLPEVDEIRVISFDLPSVITLEAINLPSVISVEFPKEMPVISFDISSLPTTIKVVGMPETIKIEHNIPSAIPLFAPEELKVPLVFDGPPLTGELKVNWGFDKVFGDEVEQPQCFTIIPCRTK